MEQNINDWYKSHGMQSPDEADAIFANRMLAEQERLEKRDEDFWNKIGERVKFKIEITEIDPPENCNLAKLVKNPEDIIIHFEK